MNDKNSHSLLYQPLWNYIKEKDAQTLTLSFAEIETIQGIPINHAFLNHKKELHAYGWTCLKISLKEHHMTFLRLPENSRILEKPHFSVLGKEGSTDEGPGFIQRLWSEANNHFDQIAPFAKKDEKGKLCGLWGVMSDMTRSFKPWENNFSKGLYLAGVECLDDIQTPEGWTCWNVPGFEYLSVPCDAENVFETTIAFLKTHKLRLVGAVHDFTNPSTGKSSMYFPIRSIQ
ncbi:MAG: GyrI-like domain-containing protein [Sphaerochaeta sp.]|nr:GyrI-like domain-containing protein [Sphaerochaeta sp.]